MKREDAIRAMLEGKKVRHIHMPAGCYSIYDTTSPIVFIVIHPDGTEIPQGVDWHGDIGWEIVPEPTRRTMTRDEVLGFLANTPGIVVRVSPRGVWCLPARYDLTTDIEGYEYAEIYPDGTIGIAKKFEVDG